LHYGGKGVDGVVLVSYSKVTYETYEDHPPSYEPKLHSEFCPIVIGGAGSTDLYTGFRTNVLFVTQSGAIIAEDIRLEQLPIYANHPIQTSGIMHMSSSEHNFASLHNNFANLANAIKKVKLLEIKRKLRNFDCHINRRQGNSGAYILKKGNQTNATIGG
jgi:hypothetical protein